MKIYIAGKIAGDRRYRAKFREAAMGLSRKDAYGAIRITLAETNTEAEVDYIGDQLAEIVRKLRG